MVVLCLALETHITTAGDIVQREGAGDRVAVDLEAGDIGGYCAILGIKQLQVCVEEASCSAGQSDVIPLDGCLRLNAELLQMIYNDNDNSFS